MSTPRYQTPPHITDHLQYKAQVPAYLTRYRAHVRTHVPIYRTKPSVPNMPAFWQNLVTPSNLDNTWLMVGHISVDTALVLLTWWTSLAQESDEASKGWLREVIESHTHNPTRRMNPSVLRWLHCFKTRNYTHLTCHLRHISYISSTIQMASMSLPEPIPLANQSDGMIWQNIFLLGFTRTSIITSWGRFVGKVLLALRVRDFTSVLKHLEDRFTIPDGFVYFFSNQKLGYMSWWGLSSKVLWNHGWTASLLGRFTFPKKTLLVADLAAVFFQGKSHIQDVACQRKISGPSRFAKESQESLISW